PLPRKAENPSHEPLSLLNHPGLWTGGCGGGRLDFAPVMEKIFVTGAAGFIGSSLGDRLLAGGKQVVGWGNFSTGQRAFLKGAEKNPHFTLVRGDNLRLGSLTAAMAGCDTVFHLAANADVRFGLEHPNKDLQQNVMATFNVLEAMRANGIKT